MKIRAKQLNEERKIQTLDALYTAAAGLRGRAPMKQFLRDLLTESERLMLGRRILIARHLLNGSGYHDIAADLGVGYDTIGRVHRWLRDEVPGYENAIHEVEKSESERSKKRAPLGTIAHLKKKYPLHFLFFPWPEHYRAPVRKSLKKKASH